MVPIVFVAGALANKPLNGGAAWTRLSWVMGLRKLGFRVVFVEELRKVDCLNRSGAASPFEGSLNLDFFREVTTGFGLEKSASLIFEKGESIEGVGRDELFDLAGQARMLLNISGHLSWQPLFDRLRPRIYLDLDPGFTQIWRALEIGELGLERHDLHFTVGENIGQSECSIPTTGLSWFPIRQPVVLEDWPCSPLRKPTRFTTVSSWRGPFGSVSHRGRTMSAKHHQFRKFLDLPRKTSRTFEVALAMHESDASDRRLLGANGWHVVDPTRVVSEPLGFRRFVQRSGAEFSPAQGVYIETRSGWFSDRSTRYLASGRPVLVQDTGLSLRYPIGKGLLTFRNLDEAVAGVEEISANSDHHGRAARSLAEKYFDSDKVLRGMTERVGISVP